MVGIVPGRVKNAAGTDAVVVGPDRVEATVYTPGVKESLGEKVEYRVAFHAAVKKARGG